MWTPVATWRGGAAVQWCSVSVPLCVVGGRDGLKVLNTVECYKPRIKTWSVKPPVSTHGHGLGVAVLEDPVYAVGRHDGWSYLNTVQRCDLQARQWNFVATVSIPRSTEVWAVLRGKLHVIGGHDRSACLKWVECFGPHTNKWILCAQMSKRRGGVGATAWNRLLCAMEGHRAHAPTLTSRLSDHMERYDPQTGVRTAAVPVSISRAAVGTRSLGDKSYAIGGCDGHTHLNTVDSGCSAVPRKSWGLCCD